MGNNTVLVDGASPFDKLNRKKSLQTLSDKGSTEALSLLAELVQRDGANETIMSHEEMLRTFL